MKWAVVILAFGGLLIATVAADFLSVRQVFELHALQPIHYLGRDEYDLSAIRRQPAQRHRVAPSLRNDQPNSP
jgi:hypothetical protein